MKTIKFNILNLFFLLCCTTFFIGCSNDNDELDEDFFKSDSNLVMLDLSFYGQVDEENDEILTETTTFDYEFDGKNYNNEIVIEYSWNSEELTGVYIESDVFDNTRLTKNEIESDFEKLYNDDDDNPNDGMSTHTRCIESCKDKYKEDEGYNDEVKPCKFHCWVDTTVRILTLGLAK